VPFPRASRRSTGRVVITADRQPRNEFRSGADGNTYQQRRLADGSTWEVIKNFPAPAEIAARLDGLGQVTITKLRYYWTAVCTVLP
jgi:hypothetical protein